MVKRILVVIMLIVLTAIMTSCATRMLGNRAVGGSDVQTMHYAYISLPGKYIVE